LSAAQYAPYGNLRELKNVVVTVSDDPAVEVAVPTLSAATLNEGNYQGQYVRVTNLTPQSSFVGEAWATSAKRVVRFDAAGGETVQSYMATATDAAGFAAITIADKDGRPARYRRTEFQEHTGHPDHAFGRGRIRRFGGFA